ncbi:glutathione S-transferase protein [Ostertagia ostertagi]
MVEAQYITRRREKTHLASMTVERSSAVPFLKLTAHALPSSYAIVRYCEPNSVFAGKSAWEEAQVDAIADQHKDFLNEVRPYFMVLMGMSKGDADAMVKDVFEPARQKYFTIITKILKENKTGYLVGNSLTFADLYVAEMTTFLEKHPQLYDGFPEMKAHAEKVRSTPKLKKWIETRPDSKF